jgi:dephospho-CoA kinase
MYIVGLTGGIGSGKSQAESIFKKLKVPIVDLDQISKQITQKNTEGYSEIVKKFGVRYLNEQEELNRYLIKEEIFKNNHFKKDIESILHPLIFTECIKFIEDHKKAKYIVVVIPLLFESKNFLGLINESLLIDCDIEHQISRVKKRDNLGKDLIISIINSQMSRSQKQKKADKIVLNDSSVNELEKKIISFHNYLLKKIND